MLLATLSVWEGSQLEIQVLSPQGVVQLLSTTQLSHVVLISTASHDWIDLLQPLVFSVKHQLLIDCYLIANKKRGFVKNDGLTSIVPKLQVNFTIRPSPSSLLEAFLAKQNYPCVSIQGQKLFLHSKELNGFEMTPGKPGKDLKVEQSFGVINAEDGVRLKGYYSSHGRLFCVDDSFGRVCLIQYQAKESGRAMQRPYLTPNDDFQQQVVNQPPIGTIGWFMNRV